MRPQMGGEGWMRLDVGESHFCGVPMGWKDEACHGDGMVMWSIEMRNLK
jgi:hypothetical protein